MRSICVFCGSSMGNKIEYTRAAKKVGEYLVKNKIKMIFIIY